MIRRLLADPLAHLILLGLVLAAIACLILADLRRCEGLSDPEDFGPSVRAEARAGMRRAGR